jgi:hypothetical protein
MSDRQEVSVRLRRAVPLAVSMLLATGAGAAANDQDHHRGGRSDFVPVHRLAGSTGGELSGEWWARVLAIPAAQNPLTDPAHPQCFSLGRHGRVLAPAFAGGGATCVLPAGRRLFLQLSSAECSSAEPPPFRFTTEEEQRACAVGFAFSDTFVTAIRLSLDGRQPLDVHQERFQVVSPQFTTVFPAGPIFDAQPGPATFVAAGYAAKLRHRLRPGRHVVTDEVTLPDGSVLTATIALDVLRRGQDDGTRRSPHRW